MPSKTRMTYKRELERANGNIDWAVEHVGRVAETYKEHHPDIAAKAMMIMQALETIKETVISLNKTI